MAKNLLQISDRNSSNSYFSVQKNKKRTWTIFILFEKIQTIISSAISLFLSIKDY